MLAKEKSRLLKPWGWINLSYFGAVKVEKHWFFSSFFYEGE